MRNIPFSHALRQMESRRMALLLHPARALRRSSRLIIDERCCTGEEVKKGSRRLSFR